MKQWAQNKQGFTIVELLIVIVIIAILAALVIVAYIGIQQRATMSSIRNDVRQFVGAIERYKAEFGAYPAGGSELNAIRSKVVQNSYDLTGGNFIYCVSSSDDKFTFGVRDKTNKMYAQGSDLAFSEVTPSSHWNNGASVVCPATGITQTFWQWGYQPSTGGWGSPGWRSWVSPS